MRRTPGMLFLFGSEMNMTSLAGSVTRCRSRCRYWPGKFWWTNRYFTQRSHDNGQPRGRRRPGPSWTDPGSAFARGRGGLFLGRRCLRLRGVLRLPGGGFFLVLVLPGGGGALGADQHLERLDRRQALGLARLARRDRADGTAVHEGCGVEHVVGVRRRA